VLVIYVPFLRTAFHTVPLTGSDWMIATGVAATLLVAIEALKLVVRLQNRTAREHEGAAGTSPFRA
jgi:hypothetical protein